MKQKIKHLVRRLTIEEKTFAIGSFAILMGSFFPWHIINMLTNQSREIENAFTGDLGVIGFSVFLMTVICLLFLVSKHTFLPLPQFGFKKDHIMMFFMGENAFLLLLTLGIYTKKSLGYIDAGIGFGLYTCLIGAGISAFAIFAQIQKDYQSNIKEQFGEEETIETKVAIKHEVPKPSQTSPIYKAESQDYEEGEVVDQSSYFLREAGVKKEANSQE